VFCGISKKKKIGKKEGKLPLFLELVLEKRIIEENLLRANLSKDKDAKLTGLRRKLRWLGCQEFLLLYNFLKTFVAIWSKI